jgi:hypothetical protein
MIVPGPLPSHPSQKRLYTIAIAAMCLTALANLTYLYAIKRASAAALRHTGFHPWGVNPFYVQFIAGRSLAFAGPPSILGIFAPSLLAAVIVFSIIMLCTAPLRGVPKKNLPSAIIVLPFLLFFFWSLQQSALAPDPPHFKIDLQSGQITRAIAPSIALQDVTGFTTELSHRAGGGALVSVTTRQGYTQYLVGIPCERYYEIHWEAGYISHAIAGFISSHGQNFPDR